MKLRNAGVLWVIPWIAAAFGLVYLGMQPGDLGHALFGTALCGPWG
jgi:hypothetical protein